MVKDYANTLIYKIICNDTSITDSYVGHTTHFNKRRRCHKSSCNNEKSEAYNFPVYKFIRSQGGWENFTMFEICKYPCNSKEEATIEERRFIELLNCTLNRDIPGRSQKEYREDNKEKITAYREDNKEKIAENKKKYYETNKEKIAEYQKQKITCDCGCVIVKRILPRHKKTKKHLKLIKLKI